MSTQAQVQLASASAFGFGPWIERCKLFLPGVLQQNNMLSAGLALMAVSTATSLLKHTAQYLWHRFKHLFIVTVEVTSRDESFNWILEWLQAHPYAKHSTSLSVSTTYYEYDEGDKRPLVMLIPNLGNHFLRYKGYFMWLNRTKEENYPDLLAPAGALETLTITTLRQNRERLVAMITEAMELAQLKEDGKTLIYTAIGTHWERFGPARTVRPLASVILEKGMKEFFLRDINDFFHRGEWYRERGIPCRRGYLLYGPPGAGKTATITALAGHLHMSICIVNLSNKQISDEGLTVILNKTPTKRCIILLEDIDVAHAAVSREDSRPGVTLSGLLNALDGVASQEGRLVFMTTNHVERLDEALLRPGRIDVKKFFGFATPYQTKHMFQLFYPGDKALAGQFVKALSSASDTGNVSTAQLQSYFMMFKDSAQDAVQNVHRFQEITTVIRHHRLPAAAADSD